MIIGKKLINRPVILAPMAGVSDFPYRQIAREMGCQLLYSEMISSKGLVYGNKKTGKLIDFSTGKEGFISIQIFGEEPEYMARAARIIARNYQPDFLDINMGCPTPKIVKTGSGAALMREPDRAKAIMEAVINSTNIPVTIKLRKGWDSESVNALEIALMAEELGIAAIVVHGRTREQFYKGEADWGIIKEIKANVKIPVIGNGDIDSPKDAREMMAETGCDAVMIGRAARGNPWLLKRVLLFLEKGILLAEPSYEERVRMVLKHTKLAVDYYGGERAIPLMRKHISWYFKGLIGSKYLKTELYKLENFYEVKALLNGYIDYLDDKGCK